MLRHLKRSTESVICQPYLEINQRRNDMSTCIGRFTNEVAYRPSVGITGNHGLYGADGKEENTNVSGTLERTTKKDGNVVKDLMSSKKIEKWISQYNLRENYTFKTIALITAGNIPLVGLHDLAALATVGIGGGEARAWRRREAA